MPTPEVLNASPHCQPGKPMPADLVAKIKRARTFNQGFDTVEYLAAAIGDMKVHLAGSPRTSTPQPSSSRRWPRSTCRTNRHAPPHPAVRPRLLRRGLFGGPPLPASCDFTTMGDLADAAATAAGYNISNYINRFYVWPGDSGCGWAGLAYVGFPYQAWSAGYNALWVYGHELGHNFTLYHAGSLDCAPQVLGGTCSLAEYGDRFDVMGNNASTGQQMHFNATQKALLGWIRRVR